MRCGNDYYDTSEFYCTECGNKGIPLFRQKSKVRESGHLKVLYCPHCRKDVNFVEIRPRSPYTLATFKIEFNEGNFENGVRKMTYRQCIAYHEQKGEGV